LPDGSIEIGLTPIHDIVGRNFVYLNSSGSEVTRTPPEDLLAEPKYFMHMPWYSAIKLSSGEDRVITVAIDNSADGSQRRIYVDQNNNNDLTDDGPGLWDIPHGSHSHLFNVAIDIEHDEGTVPHFFNVKRRSRFKAGLSYTSNSAREGELLLNGKRYRFWLLDKNSDGRFDDLVASSLYIDRNGDGRLGVTTAEGIQLRRAYVEYLSCGQPFELQGETWKVSRISSDGLKIAFQRSEGREWLKNLQFQFAAPDFSGKALNGQMVSLSEKDPSVECTVLFFYAGAAPACRMEFRHMQRLAERYGSSGLRMIGFNVDRSILLAHLYARQMPTFPHLFDAKNDYKTADAYRVSRSTPTPRTYILGRNNFIVDAGLLGEALERKIREQLGPR
jgi:peroxiredoxin